MSFNSLLANCVDLAQNDTVCQMSIKRPTSGGQTCVQEAAVQWTFHLQRSSFFLSFGTNGKDSM